MASRADGIGVVILSPTRELALQIFDVLRSIGVHHELSAGLIIGGKSVEEEQARINGMNILVCTPGRLLQHMDQTYGFDCSNVRMLVLDEADRILDMGFRQTMNDIVANLPPNRQTLLFSATQTRSVRDLARLSLSSPEYLAVHELDELSTPQQLQQHYMEVAAHSKFDVLFSFIKTHLKCKTLVFVSACKQVRFAFEMFRRVRPGVPLLHLHGKMNQAKRMALYYQFCEKQEVVMFATDVAARGLDFPDVDWIVQMDAPDSVATYIHRVGRTARYRAGGKALMLVLPSEMRLVEKLQAAKVNVSRVNVNPSQLKSVAAAFQSFMIEDTELKFLAQKALLAYLKSVYLQSDKDVFDLSQIDVHSLAVAMGLQAAPKLTIKVNKRGVKDKNVPYQLRAVLEGRGVAVKSRPAAADEDERGMKEMDRLLKRKSQGPLSEQRMRMAAGDGAEEDDGQDVLIVKRTHHVDEDDKQEVQNRLKEISALQRLEREEEREEADEEGGRSWIEAAVQQLAESDITDKQRERDRVHSKHQQRRMKERAHNMRHTVSSDAHTHRFTASAGCATAYLRTDSLLRFVVHFNLTQGRAASGEVQLAQDSVDERDVEEEQTAEGDSGDSSRDDDDIEIPIRGESDVEQEQEGEDENAHTAGEESEDHNEEAALQRSSGKRKQPATSSTMVLSRVRRRRRVDIASLPLSEQEAMALRVLQSGS